MIRINQVIDKVKYTQDWPAYNEAKPFLTKNFLKKP